MKNTNNNKLHPQFITGFTDAEGCFMISIIKDNRQKVGWRVNPCFQINLHGRDIELIEEIKNLFNCGNITFFKLKPAVYYSVQNIEAINNIIIPHFDKYSLITQKYSDYILWRTIIELINKKEHLNKSGLIKILNLKASLNKGLSKNLKLSFPDIILREKPKVILPLNIDYYWFAGFFSGEGCFFIDIFKSKTHKIGYSVILRILVTQDLRDQSLIKSFINLFDCGYITYSKNILLFAICKFDTIYNQVIPFFNQYKIEGIKYQDFQDFCEAAELIKNKEHLTHEGLEKIRLIKGRMNKARYIKKDISKGV